MNYFSMIGVTTGTADVGICEELLMGLNANDEQLSSLDPENQESIRTQQRIRTVIGHNKHGPIYGNALG